MAPSISIVGLFSRFMKGILNSLDLSRSDEVIVIALVGCLLACGVAVVFYRRNFLGTKWAGWLWVLVSSIVLVDVVLQLAEQIRVGCERVVGRIVLPNPWPLILLLFALPFCVRMFNKWTGVFLTEAERLPNGSGVRAWMGLGNVSLATLVALSVWLAFGYPFLLLLAILLLVVVAYPLIRVIANEFGASPEGVASTEPDSQDLTEERRRILKMLEAGKISVGEAEELLGALE